MYDYKNKKENKEFTSTIEKAISEIENFAEQQLYRGKPTGAIFWLKNHGWKDKTEVDASTSLKVEMGSVKVDGKALSFNVGSDVKDD